MVKSIVVALLVLTALPLFSQTSFSKIDSLVANANYEEAKILIQKLSAGKVDPKTSALLSNRMAEVLIAQGRLDESEKLLTQIDPKGDAFVEAVTKTNLGFLYLNKARNDLALENLQQALVKFQDSGNRNTREAAKCLATLTVLYWNTGKLNQAEETGLIALQIRQSLFGENSEEVAASYNDLGLVYGQSDPDKALEYYEKAYTIYEKVHGKDHPKIAIASNNIGAMYRQMELYGDAINYFETALAIWTKVYPGGHPNQAAAMINLGRTYKRMGNNKVALEYFEKAIAINRKAYGAKHPDISAVLNLVATSQLEENQFDEALKSLQEAIIANTPAFNDQTLQRNPRIGDFYNGKVLLYSLRLKAEALEARHYGKTLKLEDLKLALSSLSSCDTLIDDIRHHSTDENDKIELGASANEVYEDGVRLGQAMSEISLDNEYYRKLSFYFAEKSKSAVLQESIAETEAKNFAGIPTELLEQESSLKSTIAFLSQKLSQKPSSDEEKYLREALFSTNNEYQAFARKLETDYPNYYNLKFNSSSPAVTDLQKILAPNTAIVSYFMASKSKRIYQFIITQKNFRIRNLTLPDDFNKYTKGLTNSILYNDAATYVKTSQALSKILMPPLPHSITELVIIPSGRLGTIPFEVLFYKKSRTSTYAAMPLALKRYAISYEFSAGLLLQKEKSVSLSAPSIFLCAPIKFQEKDQMNDLPGTEAEVKAIAGLFGANSSYIAKFADANEDLVKSGTLSNYNYLHFATHGIVDETAPELSRIFLQPKENNDGNLFAGEIYNLRLNAELTVLSACQTGLGKLSDGEGVIGLSRALVYAGSRNIVVSFWSVADESTSILMTDFYRSMLSSRNSNFRVSLQQSKLKMLQGGKYSAPFYWAPFVLIGF